MSSFYTFHFFLNYLLHLFIYRNGYVFEELVGLFGLEASWVVYFPPIFSRMFCVFLCPVLEMYCRLCFHSFKRALRDRWPLARARFHKHTMFSAGQIYHVCVHLKSRCYYKPHIGSFLYFTQSKNFHWSKTIIWWNKAL